jgi:hypothetical protein
LRFLRWQGRQEVVKRDFFRLGFAGADVVASAWEGSPLACSFDEDVPLLCMSVMSGVRVFACLLVLRGSELERGSKERCELEFAALGPTSPAQEVALQYGYKTPASYTQG